MGQGITFSFSGEERPFPLDLVPRVISAAEWSVVAAGVAQRVRALEAFLDDIYGAGEILAEGLVPRRLVVTSKHFHREAAGIRAPNGVRVHVAGIDLARGSDGRFCVLEDNVRTPSGISYVVENRRTESLYWMGRYVERAEDTARILDVQVHHHLEDPSLAEELVGVDLLAAMGVSAPSGLLDTSRVAGILTYGTGDPSSIVGALRAARENARGAREAMSSEIWECLNSTYNALPRSSESPPTVGLHSFFSWVKERAALMAGLADSTMNRDEGWQFLLLGRSLERVDMTTRLIAARSRRPVAQSEWVSTLRCCSGHEAFLRTYHRSVESSLVVEFLLLDRLFPRSAFHALGEARRCLAELEPDTGRSGVGSEATRVIGRARTELEFVRLDQLMVDLPGHLARLQMACMEARNTIAARFFRVATEVDWSLARAGAG
ncbi:MAG: alpha-E domain-containing protein [Acidimicrobiales bacterium]